jgi:sterol desaturase/sphingolipid hydroxylase (fatty acid hydroxylase superfamily)
MALIEYEPLVRFGFFSIVLVVVALWEVITPRRSSPVPRRARWPHNLGLLFIDMATVRLVAPGVVIAVALAGEQRAWGVLNNMVFPVPIAVVLSVLLLDGVIYFQHVMFHAVPTLWRLHRVHHADIHFDVTTGVRFHPVEILISTAIKCAAVAAIGASAVSVLLFEVLLNATAMFNHANASIPSRIERWLRWAIVTPDMHRVHHSVRHEESSSNFSFNLPWWGPPFRDVPRATRCRSRCDDDRCRCFPHAG